MNQITIYNNNKTISTVEYIELLQSNSYQNVKLVKDNETIASQVDIFLEIVKRMSSGYQLNGNHYHFNFNYMLLSFEKNDDFTKMNFVMNGKRSHFINCFQMYPVPFEVVLTFLLYCSKNTEEDFYSMFDSLLSTQSTLL